MKKHELDALRDFAIEHLPAAQRQRESANRFGRSQDMYYRDLFVAAVQTQGRVTASAIESSAARLLQQLILLALDHRYEGIESTIISAANDLASLTSTAMPWLPAAQAETPTEQDAEPKAEPKTEPTQPHARLRSLSIADLAPGQVLTTEQAASALGREPNTLRTWASKETGDIQPAFKVGREHRWRADDILALVKAKGRKAK